MTRACFTRLSLFFVVALGGGVAGCECSPPPTTATCDSRDDCDADEICVDARCEPAPSLDAAITPDASPHDAGSHDGGQSDAGCVSSLCGDVEDCYDGLDRDCDGTVDEGCACAPGTTTRCLPGGTTPTAGRCGWGEMTCVGGSEFGTWGECRGEGASDGGTTLYGCRRIGIMGAPGANASSNFQAWLETQGAIATRFHADASASTLTRAELETFDLVVVDWLQRLYTAEEATTLSEWVRGGGALMVMTGHDSGATADRHVSLLVTLGPSFDLPAGPLSGPATLVPHPTTADGAGTLPPVSFYGGLRTTVPAELMTTIVPIAVIGEDVVGVAGPLEEGHVLLFGDEWIEFDSEWATMPSIPQLWLNAVTWLSPDEPLIPLCE